MHTFAYFYLFHILKSLYECVFCLHVCLCTMCKECPQRPEQGLNRLDLELHMAVSCHVDARSETWSSGRAASALNHADISSSIYLIFMLIYLQ